MAKAKIIKATERHVAAVAENMRDEDRMELMACGHKSPHKALTDSLQVSSLAWTAIVGDEPVAMFGVAPVSALGGIGSPWMLGTDGILDISLPQFVRECRSYLSTMLRLYPHLTNHVDCRNKVSLRWLKWLGFKFDTAINFGVNGERFYPFSIRS